MKIYHNTPLEQQVNRDIGLLVAAVRQQHKVSLHQLSHAIGVKMRYLDNLECGRVHKFPNWFFLAKILAYFHKKIRIELVDD